LMAYSRTLTDDSVTAWGAFINTDTANHNVNALYYTGYRFSDSVALTMGPGVDIMVPEEGDMTIGLTLADLNLAGEFMFNDWIGMRGSVTGSVGLDNLTGGNEGEMAVVSGVGAGFGATFASDNGSIDINIDPSQVLGGPYFLTGNPMGTAANMSIRFDI